MTIDLRKYYLGSSDELEWDLELSGMELGGVKPFCAPVKVRGQLKGSPDSVEHHPGEGAFLFPRAGARAQR